MSSIKRERSCKFCGKTFLGYHTTLYCSDECYNKFRRKERGYENLTHCLKCGKELTKRQVLFCSRECKNVYNLKNRFDRKYCNKYYSKTIPFLSHLLTLKKYKRQKLSKDFLFSLWEKQDGKCAISGIPMTHERGKGIVHTNISIDRIDSSKGYEPDNVQLVCRGVNCIKSDMSMDDLYNFCENVLKNRAKR